MKKIILFILLLCACSGAGYYYWQSKTGTNDVTYLTEKVTLGSIRKTINASGQVGPVEMVDVGAQVSGQIQNIHVKLGQQVEKGDLLVEIDSTTKENDLNTARSKLASYQAQLDSKNIALKMAQAKYAREKKLRQQDATSKENLEDAENSLAAAESAVKELEATIKQTELSVSTAETNLGYTRISAPRSGIIVSLLIEEGQTVNANQTTPTLLQIVDLGQMELKLEISEGDITKVSAGMPVEYSILSEPDRKYKTTLQSIDPANTVVSDGSFSTSKTSSSSSSTSSNSAIYYYAKSTVDNASNNLRIGMTIQASIIADSAENTLLVPASVIQGKGNRRSVRVLLPNKQVEVRPVKIGISDGVHTQILSGVQEGETIVSTQMKTSETAVGGMGMPGMGGPRPR